MTRMGTLPLRVAVLLCVALPACAAGPRGFEEMEGFVTPLSVEPPPIYGLIGYRSELDLTSHQVAGLDSIARAVQERNRPLLDSLAVSGRRDTRQPGVYRVTPETEPIVEEIMANNLAASEGVAALLTEAQEGEVCRRFESREQPDGRGGTRAPGANGSDGQASRTRRSWHWCTPPAAAEGEATVSAEN